MSIAQFCTLTQNSISLKCFFCKLSSLKVVYLCFCIHFTFSIVLAVMSHVKKKVVKINKSLLITEALLHELSAGKNTTVGFFQQIFTNNHFGTDSFRNKHLIYFKGVEYEVTSFNKQTWMLLKHFVCSCCCTK